jgi:hypothetical protein
MWLFFFPLMLECCLFAFILTFEPCSLIYCLNLAFCFSFNIGTIKKLTGKEDEGETLSFLEGAYW